jgi:RNA polymerase sigma-70 factor (ECF subfamily)
MEETININKRIIDKCLQGDIKAQFQLYKKYSKAMYNISIRFLNNKMDAEDILQESFITAFERLGELKNESAFGSWLKRIVINKCISLQRKNKIHFENIDDYKLNDDSSHEDIKTDVDPAIIHKAIKELPAGGRTVLVLFALEGYKHKEIADMLNISISTSKSQYSRALAILNKKLKNKVYVD